MFSIETCSVFALTQSALHGKLSGLVVMVVLCTGLLVHTGAVVFGVVAMIGGVLGEWLNRSEHAQRAMNWVAATIFVALAIKPVTAER